MSAQESLALDAWADDPCPQCEARGYTFKRYGTISVVRVHCELCGGDGRQLGVAAAAARRWIVELDTGVYAAGGQARTTQLAFAQRYATAAAARAAITRQNKPRYWTGALLRRVVAEPGSETAAVIVGAPRFALTLLPPNAHLIAFGPKRLENRNAAVATMARKIIGARVALTCSAVTSLRKVRAARSAAAALLPPRWPVTSEQLARAAGHWIASATVAAVLSPEAAAGQPFHIAGQWGIVLADVAPLARPVPATGDLGVWRTRLCGCGRLVSATRDCRSCAPPRGRK